MVWECLHNCIYNFSSLSLTQFLSISLLLICFTRWVLNTSKSKTVPPGPWGLPLIGNIHQFGNKPWIKCLQWKQLYGPIITVKIANLNAIVLTDGKIIREAFALPALAGRPKLKLSDRPNGEGIGPVHGPKQVEQRQFTMKQLKNLVLQNQSQKLEESIQEELLLVIRNIEEEGHNKTPIQIHHRFSIPTISSLWSVFMGHRVGHDDTRMLKILKLVQEASTLDGILSKLSMFLPIMSTLFPEATGKNKWIRECKEAYEFLEEELHQLPPNYIPGQPTNYREAYADMIQMNKDDPSSSFYPSRRTFPFTVFDILSGAVETTGTTLEWALITLVRNPKVQQVVFNEVHSACDENMPTLLDRPKCPYTEAVVHEILRRHNVLPIAIPHIAIEEVPDFYGYTIKKDTMVLANVYGVQMDPEIWGDPENFRPERFLDNPENRKYLLTFSTGKRSCIGESIAKDQLFLYIATLVQKFHIQPDPKNPPTLEALSALIYAPKPFKLIFVKR